MCDELTGSPYGYSPAYRQTKWLPVNSSNHLLLVHGQVTIIFVVSVCLLVCVEFFSAVFDPISIKLGHVMCLGLVVSLEYRGCATTGGWVTPKKLVFLGVLGSKNNLVLQFKVSSDCADFWLYCTTHQF